MKIPLELPPGLFGDDTSYDAAGRWEVDMFAAAFLRKRLRAWGPALLRDV